MKEYKLEILGDNTLAAHLFLGDDEAAAVKKVISALCPDGPFAPSVFFHCLTDIEAEKKKAAEEKRRQAEEKKARERAEDARAVWMAAFEKAGVKF